MSISSTDYRVVCDVCGVHCTAMYTRNAARTMAKRSGWFRRRGDDGHMMDVCPDCHYRATMGPQYGEPQQEVQP